MSCPKAYTEGEMKAQYKDWWNVALNFRYIKTTPGLDVLSCRTPAMIKKEIWVYLLAYYLIRTLIARAAVQAGCLPTELSFKHSIQRRPKPNPLLKNLGPRRVEMSFYSNMITSLLLE